MTTSNNSCDWAFRFKDYSKTTIKNEFPYIIPEEGIVYSSDDDPAEEAKEGSNENNIHG